MPLNKHLQYLFEALYYIFFGVFCFFIISYIYKPELLYFKLQPFFSTDPGFITYNLHQQHGYITLLSQFLMQFLYYPFLGSIILSLALVLFAIIYRFILSGAIHSFGRGIELLPALIVLVSLKYYSVTLDGLCMFLIIGLLVLINRLVSFRQDFIKLAFQFIIIFLVLITLGILSAFALLLFLVTDQLVISKNNFRFVNITANIIFFIIISYAFFGFTLVSRISRASTSAGIYDFIPSYWYLILAHLLLMSLSLLSHSERFIRSKNKLPRIIPQNWIILFLFIAVGLLYSKKLFVNDSKYNSEIEYYATEKKWEKVLKLNGKTTLDDRISKFLVNRALYETGQMSDNLFSISQVGGEYTLMLTKIFTHECTMYSSDFFYDLGFIKGANYWALEAQTFNPYSPRILMRIATSSLLLGEFANAEKYLSILNKSVIYHQWASDQLNRAYKIGFNQVRQSMLNDSMNNSPMFYIDNENPGRILSDILKENGNNKMAFEYLESYYLMTNDLGNFFNNLSFLANLNYQKIPDIYQQALIIYYIKTEKQENEFTYPIDIPTRKKFMSFNKILYQYRTNPEMAQATLRENFENTYWYYLRYNSPLANGRTLKKRKI